jgi:hypothetical protein
MHPAGVGQLGGLIFFFFFFFFGRKKKLLLAGARAHIYQDILRMEQY